MLCIATMWWLLLMSVVYDSLSSIESERREDARRKPWHFTTKYSHQHWNLIQLKREEILVRFPIYAISVLDTHFAKGDRKFSRILWFCFVCCWNENQMEKFSVEIGRFEWLHKMRLLYLVVHIYHVVIRCVSQKIDKSGKPQLFFCLAWCDGSISPFILKRNVKKQKFYRINSGSWSPRIQSIDGIARIWVADTDTKLRARAMAFDEL